MKLIPRKSFLKVCGVGLAMYAFNSMPMVNAFASNSLDYKNAWELYTPDEIFSVMTFSDHEACYNYLVEYKRNNSGCTNEELDDVAKAFYSQLYLEKKQSPAETGLYDDLMNRYEMNPDESALASQYPSDVAAVYSAGNLAKKEAGYRYNEGAYLGNQDAFRHAAWNALLVCRFYELQKGDVNWCIDRTATWTTAHETGESPSSDMSYEQEQADHEMDYYNNRVGRAAAEYNYDSETAALNEVEYSVDNGLCRRIKTDDQMTYEPWQMLEIPNWTLLPTNTVGKI